MGEEPQARGWDWGVGVGGGVEGGGWATAKAQGSLGLTREGESHEGRLPGRPFYPCAIGLSSGVSVQLLHPPCPQDAFQLAEVNLARAPQLVLQRKNNLSLTGYTLFDLGIWCL